ncbi:MAG TPA: hypothetical protein VGB84_03405 [Arachidicoccus sp.]|jgi:histidinol-phosphate/aromatic aminotransferase/cobyric acid decarboxylase-like protein
MENNITQASATDVTADIGIAYHAVAQSTAIAIQDAVENLRNVNTIALTMIGAASAQAISDPASIDQMQKVIEMAQKITTDAIENLSKVGFATKEVLLDFHIETTKSQSEDQPQHIEP